jgi:hypothetical protein
MTATRRTIDIPGYYTHGLPFLARFPGTCARCNQGFEVGTSVWYEEGELVCCDVTTGDVLDRREPIAVMPRGKTARDRCDKCFIVHASGQTQCE